LVHHWTCVWRCRGVSLGERRLLVAAVVLTHGAVSQKPTRAITRAEAGMSTSASNNATGCIVSKLQRLEIKDLDEQKEEGKLTRKRG